MENLTTVVLAVLALFFVLWIIVKLTKGIKPMSKRESDQYDVNKRAEGSDEERAFALGKTARDSAKKGGFSGWIIFIIVIVIILIWLFSNFQN